MARLEGGLFSRPRGKTGGIVFGAARTREGKVVTSRLLVAPSNPKTDGQKAARKRFLEGITIVRSLGPQVYKDDWNRAVGQLPGFQSLESVFMKALSLNDQLSVPPTIPLGTMPELRGENIEVYQTSKLKLTWINGSNIAPEHMIDELQVIIVSMDRSQVTGTRQTYFNSGALRSAQEVILDFNGNSFPFIIGMYFKGAPAGDFAGQLSPCVWFDNEDFGL